MQTVVERVREICLSKKIAISKLEKDLGYGNGYLNPKKAKHIDSERLTAIAKYLGVSVGELLGQQEKPLATEDEELDEYLEMLRTRPELRMLFRISKDATKADIEKAVAIVEALRKTEG